MKKALILSVCLILLLLWGCQREEEPSSANPSQTPARPAEYGTVTFINGVAEADAWILPQTEENRKTTLWGTATLSQVKPGESRQAPLCQPGDGGRYLIRMIDTDGFYYSADGVSLEPGWTLRVREEEAGSAVMEITDKTGTLRQTCEMFSARL